ncbi:MAG: GNAT family N-acetyltransferase [Coriobacteriia bacterium]|nr:GNAT family N-acetyltransferase [Coriobacteriia bacterium]
MSDVEFHFASAADAPTLAQMNAELIRDEGHRNSMTIPELEQRMRGWLDGEYRAVVFEDDGQSLGYALYREDSDHFYLRQLFVSESRRRQGIASAALDWLRANAWAGVPRVRVEVLVGNAAGLEFWHSVGFEDYCLTLEMESSGS